MIGGFEDPTAGRVELGGADVTDVPPYKRDVNTVFQSYALFPHLDVERNVAFGLERRKVAKAEVRRRVAEALDLVQLQGRSAGAARRSSRAASSSASPWPARSSTARARCCSTSRSARWTCSSASSCRSSSAASSARSASRSCT